MNPTNGHLLLTMALFFFTTLNRTSLLFEHTNVSQDCERRFKFDWLG
jgi:hypothetical protein